MCRGCGGRLLFLLLSAVYMIRAGEKNAGLSGAELGQRLGVTGFHGKCLMLNLL